MIWISHGAGWGEGPDIENFQKVKSKSDQSPINLFISLFINEEFKNKFSIVYCDYAK